MPETLSSAERLARLRLTRTRNVGPVTFAQLLARFGTAEAALERLPELTQRRGKKLTPTSKADAERELEALSRLGGQMLHVGEAAYPSLLAHIDAPPPLVSVLGDISLFGRRAVGMVGARNASAVGRQLSRSFASELGAAGFVVVSGLARGIDGAAHEGALATGTIAVVAGGVDHLYPAEHAALRAQIIEVGAVLSDRRLGSVPTARDFPRRNRLISGLSEGVVVIEAAKRSGSLVTARLAGEQGRDVMAVPGSPLDPRAAGANHLIKQGAALVQSADDVMAVLNTAPHQRLLETPADLFAHIPDAPEEPDDDVRARVAELLSPAPISRDALIREAGASAGAVIAVLLELELAGEAYQEPGGEVRSLSAGGGDNDC